MEITFLTKEDVLVIHADMILRYGGTPGIRDEGLLKSALAMPEAGFGDQYLHADVPAMAAAYLFHLVNNHPFIDGNKRVGTMSAYVFLDINGFYFTTSNEEFEPWVWGVAQSKISKEQITEFISTHVVAR